MSEELQPGEARVTNERLVGFAIAANAILSRDGFPADGKLAYFLRKQLQNVEPLINARNQKVMDTARFHASEGRGPDGHTIVMLRDERGEFFYTKKALESRDKELREFAQKTVIIQPINVPEIHWKALLSHADRSALNGFVIEWEDKEPGDPPSAETKENDNAG